jgi:hypothetical protein
MGASRALARKFGTAVSPNGGSHQAPGTHETSFSWLFPEEKSMIAMSREDKGQNLG